MTLNVWEGILLGVLQGLTEFLPVSSSGHLVLARTLFGGERVAGAATEAVLHLGTLAAVVVYFAQDLGRLLRALGAGIRSPVSSWRESGSFRLAGTLLLATLPAILLGLLFQDDIESLFESPRVVFTSLLVTGVVVLSTRWTGLGFRDEVGPGVGLVVGVAQALAICPGLSRSGLTIACARWLGTRADPAGRFSFLLSVPVVAGAGALKLLDLTATSLSSEVMIPLLFGTLTAFLTGLLALHLLLGLIRRGRFWVFGPYCLVVGLLGSIL